MGGKTPAPKARPLLLKDDPHLYQSVRSRLTSAKKAEGHLADANSQLDD